MDVNTIITAGALVYSYMQQKELEDSYNSKIENYKEELQSFKDQVNANLNAMDATIDDYQTQEKAPIEAATGSFIVDLAGIADSLWSSAATLTVKNSNKSVKLNLYAVVLDWGIVDDDGVEYTANWLQWSFFGKEQSTIECEKERTFKLYGTGHEKLFNVKSTREAVRKVIKNGKKTFARVKGDWYKAKGTMYLVGLTGDGTATKVSEGTPIEGKIHYMGEGKVLAPSNKRTSENGEFALRWYKDGKTGSPV